MERESRRKELDAKSSYFKQEQFVKLHHTQKPGTDLTLGMPKNHHVWEVLEPGRSRL